MELKNTMPLVEKGNKRKTGKVDKKFLLLHCTAKQHAASLSNDDEFFYFFSVTLGICILLEVKYVTYQCVF